MTDLFGLHPNTKLIPFNNTAEDPHKVRDFLLAGNAKFTIKSKKTGKHYTYRIKRGDKEVWFVSRLGMDNNYIYQGTIFPDTGFTATRKTCNYARYSEGFEVFKWFWERLETKGLHPLVEFYHAGRCGMCGIELTDPVSIKEGYGPECRKKRLRRSFRD